MKQITCEICGGKNIIKRDGAYVCADCGIKYTADEIKKLLSNTPDDVPACSEMPLENSESTPSNSSAASEIPDKINHKLKIPLIAFAACVCVALLVVAVKIVIPNVRYNSAVSLMNDGKYEEAIAAFEKLGDYKDCKELIDSCNKDKAYYDAVELMNNEKYKEAIAAFESLDGYKDSTDKIDECKLGVLKKAQIGDSIEFGSYEQDNDTTNGKEIIEWQVLDKEDNKILVISSNVLDCKPYNTVLKPVTWETCTLRTWLNDVFYNAAFDSEEQSMIQVTSVVAENNPEHNTDPGNDTEDKVFLLSVKEATNYFPTEEARIGVLTPYAITQPTQHAFSNWWLRSPGLYHTRAAKVYLGGKIGDLFYSEVDYDAGGVRPTMWIDLSA